MRAGLKRATTILLAAASAFLAGCDNDERKADRQVQQDLAEARQVAQMGGEDANQASAKLLQDAANRGDASAGVRATAKAAVAQNEMETADELLRKIDRAEMDLARVTWEISQLTEQIRTNASVVAGYKKYDPKPAREAIAQKIAEAQGGPGKPVWFTHGNATIPTLSAVKQEIARLEGEIAQRQEQVKSLTEQRGRILDDAEKAAAEADKLKGDKAVEVFKRSSELRRQAGEKAIEIEKLQAQINRLQRDLAVAQGQQTTLNEVIAQLQDQAATLDAGWKEIDVQVAKHQALTAEMLGAAGAAPAATTNEASTSADQASTSTAGGTIAQKAVELGRMAAQIRKMREDAQLNANNAVKFFDDAYKAADELRASLQLQITDQKNTGRPEIETWKRLQAVVDPMQFRMQEAAADRLLGRLWADDAVSLGRRVALRDQMSAALEGTNLAVPQQVIDGDLVGQRKAALEQADAAYKESDKLLSDIAESQAPESLKDSAHVARALTLYEWAQVARQSGNEAAAAEHIQEAISQRNLAAERNLALPAMPVELGAAPQRAVPAEAAPATEPTTEPAEPAAPTEPAAPSEPAAPAAPAT